MMSEETSRCVAVGIDEKLSRLSPLPCGQHICRVYEQLRRENPTAYEPQLVAIGPYHHNKDNVKKMEEHKVKYLQGLMKRRGESSVGRYIKDLLELEERARSSYAEPVSFSRDEFVEMLLLDGCFIIEFFRKKIVPNMQEEEDPIFKMGWLHEDVMRDLLVYENQVPFFILLQLFDMTRDPNGADRDLDLMNLTFDCLDPLHPCRFLLPEDSAADIVASRVDHLLGLIHEYWCAAFAAAGVVSSQVEIQKTEYEFTPSVTELLEAGIRFRKADDTGSESWLGIKFQQGVIEIPLMVIQDCTEAVFRNMIAYEQHSPVLDRKYVTDYTTLLNSLISSPGDAESLRHRGIIDNWLGDDLDVANTLNNLGNGVHINYQRFCYLGVCGRVNRHYHRRWNRWVALLRRNYFNNPWSSISFLAAIALLLLTFLQTLYTILSYKKGG